MNNSKLKFESLEHEVLYEYLMEKEKTDKIEYSEPNIFLTPFSKAIQTLEQLAINSGDFSIIYHKKKRFGRILIFVKRCIRKFLRWYINPIIERQNNYNVEVMNLLKVICKNIEDLSVKVKKLPIDFNQEYLFNKYSFAINYLGKGFSSPDDDFTWTDQKKAEINIPINLTKNNLKLIIRGKKLIPSQAVEIIVNNYSYGKIKNGDNKFIIKANELSGHNYLDIILIISKPLTPKELGMGDDYRTLGYALISIGIYE